MKIRVDVDVAGAITEFFKDLEIDAYDDDGAGTYMPKEIEVDSMDGGSYEVSFTMQRKSGRTLDGEVIAEAVVDALMSGDTMTLEILDAVDMGDDE